MRRLAGVNRKVRIGFSQCQDLPFLPSRKSVPASRRAPLKAERSEPKGSLERVARCKMLKAEGMAGAHTSPHLLYLRSLGKASVDRRISLPGFHSHYFSSSILGSVPVGFLSCESVLPAINRPSAEMRVGCFRLSQARQRSHRSSVSILNLPAKASSSLAELFELKPPSIST